MASRYQNERRFPLWRELPDGGRHYWLDIAGRRDRWARYNKWVDASETTLRIVQEIYDADGVLVEVHQKYPEDLGHVRLV